MALTQEKLQFCKNIENLQRILYKEKKKIGSCTLGLHLVTKYDNIVVCEGHVTRVTNECWLRIPVLNAMIYGKIR